MARGVKSRRRRIGRVRKKTHDKKPLMEPVHEKEPVIDETYESDEFFKTCISDLCSTEERIINKGNIELCADEYYVILDKVYKHSPDDNLDELYQSKFSAVYADLKQKCADVGEYAGFSYLQTSKFIRFIQLYEDDVNLNPVVKTCVTIAKDFSINILVHGQSLSVEHEIFTNIPVFYTSAEQVKSTLKYLSSFTVCIGNPDKEYQRLLPVGAYLDVAGEQQRAGYREIVNGSTIRSTKCSLLVQSHRCECCLTYRRTLSKAVWRQKNRISTPKKNWLTSKKGNKKLSESEKLHKIKQLRKYTVSLESEIDKLNRKLKKSIKENGVSLLDNDSEEMFSLMKENDDLVKQAYPVETSVQRLFWEQQIKYVKLSNKKSMKWHPMIIKWCILLKSKSSTTYDSLRKTGFINLPSERTLHDYTNVLTRGTGFHYDVIEKLQDEVSGYTERHESIVGILQDEVRIRSDLVYDKHTGELVGFIDLDNAGNNLLNIQESLKNEEKSLARYVLVIMVRGLSTKLKFPLAHFATNGVVSDQLFSILWEAVELLEIDAGLTVLFITSDGASPNRRFIRLHGQDGDNVVYRAENVFATEQRFIYFISDPPHLIKTTRNNFSNSFSHKKTKQLWRNGKHISWLHIVDLYKDKCNGLYRLCPKLSKSHIDLTAFSYMKVNLAAQVMSATVADALEMVYGDRTTETVTFIRHINKFFDIMNTRNFFEGTRKRNDNLKPFTSINDTRLTYLKDEFLTFFEQWKRQVDDRPGPYTKSQRNAMTLSYQTIEGLKITVNSMVECVEFCLNEGMPFVLTEKFNQDAIEQHFGVHRASCGSNTNPSLHEFNSTMQKLRTVGSQAIAPLRGNTKRRLELAVDNTPLAKRPRYSSENV